jgi:hypothetical protein
MTWLACCAWLDRAHWKHRVRPEIIFRADQQTRRKRAESPKADLLVSGVPSFVLRGGDFGSPVWIKLGTAM